MSAKGNESAAPKWKIPPIAVKSDSCVVYVGRRFGELRNPETGEALLDPETGEPQRGVIEEGTPYYPHTGETVWILPVTDMASYFVFGKLQDWTEGERGEQEQRFRSAMVKLAEYVVDWDWTDLRGRPLPKPDLNPEVFALLDPTEIAWLVGVVRTGGPDEEKNGAGGSSSTSSTTPPRPMKRS